MPGCTQPWATPHPWNTNDPHHEKTSAGTSHASPQETGHPCSGKVLLLGHRHSPFDLRHEYAVHQRWTHCVVRRALNPVPEPEC